MKKDVTKIGKVSLNLKEKNGNKIVTISPAANQSFEGYKLAQNWINYNFLKDSPYKSGLASFSLKDWRKDGGVGEKFIKSIKKSNTTIMWIDESEDKKIMKRLKAIIPKDTLQAYQSPSSSTFDFPQSGPSLGGSSFDAMSFSPPSQLTAPSPLAPGPEVAAAPVGGPGPEGIEVAHFDITKLETFKHFLNRCQENEI